MTTGARLALRALRALRAPWALLALCCLGASPRAGACDLVLSEHRSGRALLRLPLAEPAMSIAFTHSVLGTPVNDRYRWRAGAWHLVEERFEGQGYGLPSQADAAVGERLTHVGEAWRLSLDRRVHPLVVRPLPALGMRVLADGHPPLLLAGLSGQAILLQTAGCGE